MEIINYDDKIDQIKMDEVIFQGYPEQSYLKIHWELLYGCNYRCSYCFGQETLGNKDFTSLDKLKKAVNNIFKIEREHYDFGFQGGEATYHPNFLELLEYIYSFENKNISILLVTNGSKNIEYFKKIIDMSKCNSFRCTVSLHLEYANIEHIKDLITLFYENKIELFINFMVHPILKEKTYNFFEELLSFRKKYYFRLDLQELKEGPEYNVTDSRYDKDFFDWIDSARKRWNDLESDINSPVKNFSYNIALGNSYYILKEDKTKKIYINHNIATRNNLRAFSGFYCCAGINVLVIWNSGSYSAALCSQVKSVGNIYEDDDVNYIELSNIIKCNSKQCGCSVDNAHPKFRDFQLANDYVNTNRLKNMKLILSSINNLYNKTNNKTNNKINKIIDTLAWWIPFKKKREEFRAKFK